MLPLHFSLLSQTPLTSGKDTLDIWVKRLHKVCSLGNMLPESILFPLLSPLLVNVYPVSLESHHKLLTNTMPNVLLVYVNWYILIHVAPFQS